MTRDGLIRLTAAACFAVIAALSARRLGEIADLGAGCTYQQTSMGRTGYRSILQRPRRRTSSCPSRPQCIKAVQCMEEISKEAREITWKRLDLAVPSEH